MTTSPREAVVLDATAPLFGDARRLRKRLSLLHEGGVDAIAGSVASLEDIATVSARLADWHEIARDESAGARLATTVGEIRAAKAAGVPAIILHVQGLDAIGANPTLLELYAHMGVRMAQPTYNYRNALGDGCLEPDNAGLSEVGRKVVDRANELGIALDISHVGYRTSREMIERSTKPVIASHSNARAVCDSPRNLPDELIRAVAASGGVMGLCAFPAFVAASDATLDRLLDHAAYIADLVGPERLGIGLDFADEDEEDYEYYRYDERYYPRPPWIWPAGIEDETKVRSIAPALERRGFSPSEVAGIMGENFMRAFEEIWPA